MRVRVAAARRAAATTVLLLALGGCGADTEPSLPPIGAADHVPPVVAALPELTETPQGDDDAPRGTLSFYVTRRAQLRRQPGGRVVATLARRTAFRSPRIYAVAARKPGWVLVRTEVPGHHVGWLPTSAGRLFRQPRSIVIDLSRRSLSVFHAGRRTDVYKIAIGARGTPTPTGTFAVTDLVRLPPGTPYGCCAMALTARQPHIAQGWGGGDRIAIHATDATWSIGKAVSHGCLRSSEATLRQLMRRVRLGALVTIHA